jgi:hypothetical protein
MTKLLVCLLLMSACLPVLAREVRLHGANGDGGSCPDAVAAEAVVQPQTKGKRAVVGMPGKAKPATFRGDDGNTVRAPRWHSFVPGMFR